MNHDESLAFLLRESEAARVCAIVAADLACTAFAHGAPAETLARTLAQFATLSPALRDAAAARLESAPASLRDSFAREVAQ